MRLRTRTSLVTLAAGLLATPSLAQSNAIPQLDVALGLLGNINDVGHTGPFPTGVTGFAMSTTSCNFGTVNAAWESPMDPDHPFITFLMVRESDGRMVQISDHSYVKHGFFALSNNQCNLGCSPTSGDELGVGCSDTYGIGNNGDRFYLAPPEEIDPWTGEWSFLCGLFDGPNCDGQRSFFGSVPDSVTNRVTVQDSDLTVPGATFYYSSNYIVEHEPEAARWNNQGYRPVVITQGGNSWNVNPQGSQTPTYGSVLQEWSGASLFSTTNGGDDGRVYVASKTEALPGGGTHYEYAVHNRDNNRAVGTLRIPIAPGAQITNFGFHDIDQDATNDWGLAIVGNAIEISTPDNPVLWNSIFNFWFDADVGPVTNTVELDQFFSGNGAPTLFITADVPGEGSIAPCTQADDVFDDNDTCMAAASVTNGIVNSLFVSKTDEDWYSVLVNAGALFEVEVGFSHASGDIDLEVYDACGGTLVGSSTSATDNELVQVLNGNSVQTYLVRVLVPDSSAQDCNNYSLDVTAEPPGPCFGLPDDSMEPNDDCDAAVTLPTGSTMDLFVSKTSPDWYELTVGAGGTLNVTFNFLNIQGDIDVEVFDSCSAVTPVAESTTASNFEMVSVTNDSAQPRTYSVHVYVWSGSSSDCNDYDMTMSVVGGTPPNIVPFCFGDGSGTACPCNNESLAGHAGGCRHSFGEGAILSTGGQASVANDSLNLRITSGPLNTYGLLISGDVQRPSTGAVGSGVQMFDGLMCVGTNVQRHGTRFIGPIGTTPVIWGSPGASIVSQGSFSSGQTRHFQVVYRDSETDMCGSGQNTTNAISITVQP